jgi:hypothetical protein
MGEPFHGFKAFLFPAGKWVKGPLVQAVGAADGLRDSGLRRCSMEPAWLLSGAVGLGLPVIR